MALYVVPIKTTCASKRTANIKTFQLVEKTKRLRVFLSYSKILKISIGQKKKKRGKSYL
jgi:hypothetical protein